MDGAVFPILTFVVDMWDSERAEYDESWLVWWEVSWPRKLSPPSGNLWSPGHAHKIEWRRSLPAAVDSLWRTKSTDLTVQRLTEGTAGICPLTFNVQKKKNKRKNPFRHETSVNECGL